MRIPRTEINIAVDETATEQDIQKWATCRRIIAI